MFRLNGAYFFDGGAHLSVVSRVAPDSRIADIWGPLSSAEEWVAGTLGADLFHLKSSYPAGTAALEQIRAWKLRAENSFKEGSTEQSVGWEIASLTSAVENFATLLRAEVAVSDFYFVTNKGC